MIEDILAAKYGEFICNNAVNSVAVTAPGLNQDIYQVVTPLRWLDKNDNIVRGQ